MFRTSHLNWGHTKKLFFFFLTLNRTFLTIILESRWGDRNPNCHVGKLFPSPPSLHSGTQPSNKPQWVQVQSKHPRWISVRSVSCLSADWVFNVPKTTVWPCSPPPPPPLRPSQSLSACSFIRKTDTPSFYGWRAAINPPPPPFQQHPTAQIWLLVSSLELTPRDPLNPPPPCTPHLPAFTHLLGHGVSAQHLIGLISIVVQLLLSRSPSVRREY